MSKNIHRSRQTIWPPVTDSGKVPTKHFLDTCDTIVNFFDSLGTLFAPVKHDIQGNINKLVSKYSANPEKYETIHDMIESEIDGKECFATEALLWLKRGLHFTCLLLLSIIDDYESNIGVDSLAANYQYAYDKALKIHHNWIVQKFFTVCVKSRICPKRKDVMRSLSSKETNEESEMVNEIKQFVDGLVVNLLSIFQLYVLYGLDNCKDIR